MVSAIDCDKEYCKGFTVLTLRLLRVYITKINVTLHTPTAHFEVCKIRFSSLLKIEVPITKESIKTWQSYTRHHEVKNSYVASFCFVCKYD